jgi:putative NADH-flavin reductase
MGKIAVIGANGRTGIEIVRQALKRDIEVKALVRDKQKLTISNPALEIIEGTPMHFEDIAQVIQKVDNVFVALNICRKSDFPWSKVVSPLNLLEESMKNIVQAMKEKGIKRVLTISAWGAGSSYEETNWMFKFLINKTNVHYAYTGHEEQENLLKQSDLDWTSIRPVGLNNNQKHKNILIRLKKDDPLKMMISRKDVAKFMLDIMDDKQYFQTAPSISND